ncbi:MAG: hypothetical protein NC344_05355 [Bacteroidales bacterium]|nr:hypothetical protein [Bacteroidales bacterium]
MHACTFLSHSHPHSLAALQRARMSAPYHRLCRAWHGHCHETRRIMNICPTGTQASAREAEDGPCLSRSRKRAGRMPDTPIFVVTMPQLSAGVDSQTKCNKPSRALCLSATLQDGEHGYGS